MPLNVLTQLIIILTGVVSPSELPTEEEWSPSLQGIAESPDFWGHWGDGRAEISGYTLQYPRYGQVREGTAVTIFVTEDFAESVKVKHEDPSRDRSEVHPVMKLNWIQDFPTGVYDYSLMTSAFVNLTKQQSLSRGAPTKISFSSQEWCGHVYAQLAFGEERTLFTSHSYFDGEADEERSLPPRDSRGLAEDTVLLWARGFAGPRLDRGDSKRVSVLRSLEKSRLLHVYLEWTPATATRSAQPIEIEVPAGKFEVDLYTLAIAASPAAKSYPIGATTELPASTWTIEVESAWPHRIIRWSRSDGLKAELVGSERLAYWRMNGPGFESALEKIGLQARPPRTP